MRDGYSRRVGGAGLHGVGRWFRAKAAKTPRPPRKDWERIEDRGSRIAGHAAHYPPSSILRSLLSSLAVLAPLASWRIALIVAAVALSLTGQARADGWKAGAAA